MSALGRTHYVYRAYDEHGLLLYIGCTGRPRQRHMTHRRGSEWFLYAARFITRGPYPKAEAFEIEAAAIEAERPHFNTTRAENGRQVRRHAYLRRLINERRLADPTLNDDFDRFCAMSAEVEELVEQAYPRLNHHMTYLVERNELDRADAA